MLTKTTISCVDEVAHIQDLGRLSWADIARATTANEATVHAWSRGQREAEGSRADRLQELEEIVSRLALVMQPHYVPVWIRKPLAVLDNERPLDVIAAGESYRLLPVLEGIEALAISEREVAR
jgi:hypothetical protein